MKSQRRHDLQTNSLARALSQSPVFFRQHGGKVFLAIVIVGLVIILVRQRQNIAEQEMNTGWANITSARESIARLSQIQGYRLDGAGKFNLRGQLIESANRAVKTATAADDRALAAQGLVVQGDLNWTLANLPEIAGAATMPSLKSEVSAKDYLARAEDSYQRVLKSYKEFPLALAEARFGLAACAENKRDWTAAREQYEAIISDAALAATFKPQAEFRLKAMEQVKDPLYMAAATRPVAEAAPLGPLGPSTAGVGAAPASKPAGK